MATETSNFRHELEEAPAGAWLTVDAPQDAIPETSMSPIAAERLVTNELAVEGIPERNLATFVTTWMEPEAREVIDENLHRNFIDHAEYPMTAEIEQRCIRMLAKLFNAPGETTGARTQGSSEAIMLGALSLKWKWRERREAAGKSTDRPNLVFGGDVHVVWEKFCRYFDVEPRIVPLQPGKYTIGPEDVEPHLDENTIGIAAVVGTTFTGHADDVVGINDLLVDRRDDKGVDIPLHIDGASGAFVWPFVYPDSEWDFRLEQVKSINASGHKFGLVPPGLGWVVFRDRAVFNEELVFYVNYLGGEMPTATLNFSRGTAPIAVQAYNFLRLGREGYTRIVRHTLDNAIHLRQRLVDSGYFVIMNETQRIPVVALTLSPKAKNFNEFDVSAKVRERGWVLSAYSMPPDAQDVRSLRVVVRPHLNRTVIDSLAQDIIKACQYLEEHGGTATPPKLHTHHRSAPMLS
jgi:glutamate decarboxylase